MFALTDAIRERVLDTLNATLAPLGAAAVAAFRAPDAQAVVERLVQNADRVMECAKAFDGTEEGAERMESALRDYRLSLGAVREGVGRVVLEQLQTAEPGH